MRFDDKLPKQCSPTMEHGGVDVTVIECRQHLLGQMENFLFFIAFSVSDLKIHNVPQIKISDQAAHTDEITPTPWLTRLLVLGKSCVNQKSC